MSIDVRDVLDSLTRDSIDTMKHNLEFLMSKYRELLDVLKDLSVDLCDLMELMVKVVHRREDVARRWLMAPAVVNVAFPFAVFTYTVVLLGAIPHAFYSLRTILESIAIATYADTNEEIRSLTFDQKIEHRSVKSARLSSVRPSLEKLFKQVYGDRASEYIETVYKTYELLSAMVHPVASIRIAKREKGWEIVAAGLIKDLLLILERADALPGWAIVLPVKYTDSDLDDLQYLEQCVLGTYISVALLLEAWVHDKRDVDEDLVKHIDEMYRSAIEMLA